MKMTRISNISISRKQKAGLLGALAVIVMLAAALAVPLAADNVDASNCFLIYNANGGTGAPGVVLITDTGESSYTATVSSTKPVYTGYTFLGWSTDSSATTASYIAGDTITIPVSTSVILYAVWSNTSGTSYTFHLYFDANGGTGSPATLTYTGTNASHIFTIPSTTPARSGYTFEYWNTASDGSGIIYHPNGTTTVHDITMYAIWSQDDAPTSYTYTLSYNAAGGTGAPATQTVSSTTTVHEFTVSSTVPTYTGHTFKWWQYETTTATLPVGPGGHVDVSSTSPSITLTAVWNTESDLSWSSPAAVSALSGSAFSYTPATNISGSVITKISGDTWLSFSDGSLSGTAPAVSSVTYYSATLQAVSPGGQVASQTVTVSVYPVAQISVASTAVRGVVGTALTDVILSCNLSATYAVSDGSLPAGLTLSPAGILSGTPTAEDNVLVTVSAVTTVGPSQTATIQLSVSTAAALGITSAAPVSVYVAGMRYSYVPAASVSGVVWTVSGLTWLAVSSGAVVGTVPSTLTAVCTYSYTLTATYTVGVDNTQTATQSCMISAEPVIAFVTVPTASCVIIPVYAYDDGGVPSIASALGVSLGSALGDDLGDDADTAEAGASVEATTHTFRFVFTGDSAASLLWDFGDGTTSTDWTPVHTYASAGTYTYTCTATNSLGSDTCTGTVTVTDAPADQRSLTGSILSFLAQYWYLVVLVVMIAVLAVVVIL